MNVRKYTSAILVFLVCTLAVAMFAMFMQLTRQAQHAKEVTLESAEANALDTIEQYKSLRSYYTKNVIAKVKQEGSIAPSIEHQDREDAIPLPATMIHDLSDMMQSNGHGTKLRLYSSHPFPNRGQRKIDDFAQQAIEFLESNPDQPFIRHDLDRDAPAVRVAIADRMSVSACVSCHNSHPQSPKTDWQLGDVRGVLEVITPVGEQVARSDAAAITTTRYAWICGLLVSILVISIVFTMVVQKKSASRMRRQATKLAQSSRDVASVGRDLAENAECTASQASMAAKTSQEVGASVQLLATSIDELSHSIDEISKNVHTATDTADMAVEATEKSSDSIARLVSNSERIGQVIRDINSIAEQTNLLALNATIEAARAGAAGKGFAVVANEVKELAKETAKATETISETIKGILADTGNAQDSMSDVCSVVQQIKELQQLIASSVEKQNTVSSEVAATTSGVADNSSAISENVSEVAHRAKDSLKRANDTEAMAEQLGAIAGTVEGIAG